MKVLLVYPPFYRLMGFYNRYFPLALVSVGTALRDAGHEVVVYDADYNQRPSVMDYTRLPEYYGGYLESVRRSDDAIWMEVRRTLREFQPEVIGISIWTTYAASAFRVAELSKEINPACPVVMGGPHATVKADEVLRISPAVDYVVRGEGEVTMIGLVDRIAAGRADLEDMPGLSFRRGDGLQHNPARSRIANLDVLALPDRAMLMNHDEYSSEDMGLVMTSRGCPFSCAFCATETRRVQYRSVEHVLEEIRQVKARYGTTHFSLKDDSFTVNRKRVAAFCEALVSEGVDITWECNTRVDLVTEEMLTQMKEAGCNSIKVGIESGSEEVLKRMNKGTTLDQIRRAAGLFRKAGIYWTGYFLIGTPGETADDIAKTLDLMYEIKPDFASIGVYEPFPGAAMFDQAVERGLVKPDMTLEDFYTTLPNHYYKADPMRQSDAIEPEHFVALEQEVKSQFHRYNKDFMRVLSRAKTRTRQYVRCPPVLYADFKKYWSWR
jgi:anaerobic magnesium-protoporphyrin IX monomethyl ester cyclase